MSAGGGDLPFSDSTLCAAGARPAEGDLLWPGAKLATNLNGNRWPSKKSLFATP